MKRISLVLFSLLGLLFCLSEVRAGISSSTRRSGQATNRDIQVDASEHDIITEPYGPENLPWYHYREDGRTRIIDDEESSPPSPPLDLPAHVWDRAQHNAFQEAVEARRARATAVYQADYGRNYNPHDEGSSCNRFILSPDHRSDHSSPDLNVDMTMIPDLCLYAPAHQGHSFTIDKWTFAQQTELEKAVKKRNRVVREMRGLRRTLRDEFAAADRRRPLKDRLAAERADEERERADRRMSSAKRWPFCC